MSLPITPSLPSIADNDPEVPLPTYPSHWRSLPRVFIDRARSEWHKVAMVDSTGQSRTYGRLLIESIALARALRAGVIEGEYVGLLLPPTVPSAVANLAVSLAGYIPVNLNYTAGDHVIDSAIDQCGITHVLTSRRALERFKLTPKGTLVLLEDLPKQISHFDKALAFILARLIPLRLLGLFLPGLHRDHHDRIATVIFTSGSTGDPKGVVLTHGNILSNILGLEHHLHFLDNEVVLGILPFFHSFGFSIPLWAMLCLGKTAVYHFNPLDGRIIGHLCEEHKVTLVIAAPTFVRNWMHRCPDEQFASVRRVVTGAEKLKPELARDIQQRWNAIPLEGYGTTELSPVVGVNVDHELTTRTGKVVSGNRIGSIGRPIPGTMVKTVSLETGLDLPRGEVGIIHVKGPQVMKGYLNKPDQTSKVIRDGWYATGDLGKVDEDGFVWITDRINRFSKIGGEMVPHEQVESAIRQVTGVDESAIAVTALPDEKRGERLVVLYTHLKEKSPGDICHLLTETDLPRLWLPGPQDFLQVEAIPILGSGKLDLSRMRQLAREQLGS